MKLLPFPDNIQTYDYDCGAKALQSVLIYYGIEVREDALMKIVHTTKSGTNPQNIVAAAKKYKLEATASEMNIFDVKGCIDREIPVILALQAWTRKKKIDWINDWQDGHYVVAIGYDSDRIIFADPASVQRTYLSYDESKKRWHDVDNRGKKYDHLGIVIFGKKPKFKDDQLIHMD